MSRECKSSRSRRTRVPGSMSGTRLGRTVLLTVLAGILAGCGSSASPAGSAAAGSAATSPAAKASGSTGTASVSSAGSFTPIVEPFDPGHPARTGSAPASCDGETSTIAIEQCYDTRTENVDVAIDAAQSARYASASPSGKAAILAQDSAWLAARQPVCAVAFNTGGTIDGISAAICLLDESNARLDAVKGINPPEAKLKATDSQDPNEMSWYTTPEGSRITMTDTQGDETGGVIIGWTVIGGADGFVVNPKQFYFLDGSFTDPGIVGSPNPAYHRVAPGKEFQFGIDYSKLSQDPNKTLTGSVYVYAPGSPVAAWGAP
jgi:uncharacterized protein YecT (DUF1311 family)